MATQYAVIEYINGGTQFGELLLVTENEQDAITMASNVKYNQRLTDIRLIQIWVDGQETHQAYKGKFHAEGLTPPKPPPERYSAGIYEDLCNRAKYGIDYK